MNRAMFAGLSGTLAFQNRLDVVGNNIANSNTVGYKEGRVTFQDALYETLEGGRSGGEIGRGGSNPVQIGSGVSLGSVSVRHSQGSLERTGQPLDCAITGPGMFVLSDGQTGYYTRDGSFSLDSTNTLVAGGSGARVMGWMATDGSVNTSGPLSQLSFSIGELSPPEATSAAVVSGNLDSRAAEGVSFSSTISIYDSLGEAHSVELTFTSTAYPGEWTCSARCGSSSADVTLQFDSQGNLVSGGSVTLPVVFTNGAESPQSIEIGLDSLTGMAQSSSAVIESQNGRPAASLVSVAMSEGGLIEGRYSDGRSRTLGQVAIASFTNPGGLSRLGGNLYAEAPASGAPSIGGADSGGRGSVVAGSLELSNVDLTRSFVDMISTQRGFQASTRVIATANEMLDDVVRIIRV